MSISNFIDLNCGFPPQLNYLLEETEICDDLKAINKVFFNRYSFSIINIEYFNHFNHFLNQKGKVLANNRKMECKMCNQIFHLLFYLLININSFN